MCPLRKYVMKKEDIGTLSIGLQSKVEDNDFSGGDVNSSISKDELCDEDDGSNKGVNGADNENVEASIAYLD